jgi:glyoxylase-like metal-dependent hydrolase (beta-lactamase superfamily II)
LVDRKAILTGDTLFIGDCGRVDMSGGSLKEMYETLDKQIKPLSDDIIVYPGHDYGPKPYDTIGNLRTSIITLIKGIKEYL